MLNFREAPFKRWFLTRYLAFLGILAISALCRGQDLTSGGPDSVMAGPFGEPRMVMSEGGEWSYPLEVYANAKVEMFVPDITSPGWASWHAEEFRTRGTYYTYLYRYSKRTRLTGRETIYVDTRTSTVTVARPLVAPVRVRLSSAEPELMRSVAATTSLVEDSVNRVPAGSTVQEVIRAEAPVVAGMANLANQVPGVNCGVGTGQSCAVDNATTSGVAAYPRPRFTLILGAVPGANCGLGTERSCYGPKGEGSPFAQQSDISAPVAVFTPEAGYSDEAKRLHLQGTCSVSVLVDADGMPKGERVVHSLGHGLDEKALEAVSRYRFVAAKLHGETPVPVRITIEVHFKLY
jgi:TonB family protein